MRGDSDGVSGRHPAASPGEVAAAAVPAAQAAHPAEAAEVAEAADRMSGVWKFDSVIFGDAGATKYKRCGASSIFLFFFLFSSSSFSACALREVETESEADYFRFPSSVGQFRFPHGWNQSKQRGLQQFFNLPIASRKRGGRVELHTLESGLDATLPSQKIAISILNDDIACVVDHYLLITSAPS